MSTLKSVLKGIFYLECGMVTLQGLLQLISPGTWLDHRLSLVKVFGSRSSLPQLADGDADKQATLTMLQLMREGGAVTTGLGLILLTALLNGREQPWMQRKVLQAFLFMDLTYTPTLIKFLIDQGGFKHNQPAELGLGGLFFVARLLWFNLVKH